MLSERFAGATAVRSVRGIREMLLHAGVISNPLRAARSMDRLKFLRVTPRREFVAST
jgi:hypothetical protein